MAKGPFRICSSRGVSITADFLHPLAAAVAEAWTVKAVDAALHSVSENEIFRVSGADGRRYVLRLHRPGYQSEAGIASELAWLAALGRDTDLALPRPVAGRDDELLQRLLVDGETRFAVLFHFEPGSEPSPDADLVPLMRRLGRIAAVLHRHVEGWRPPGGITRPRLDAGALLDPHGAWGDWREAPGVEPALERAIAPVETALRAALEAYGQTPTRFGLIHADMRLGNLLIEGERICLIDFDDSGFGWFGYDFAAAVSFHETHPDLPVWRAAWLEGYRAVRPFPAEDEVMLGAMVLLRRLALLAWIGSHRETRLACRYAPGYAEGTARLAQAWLAAQKR